MKGETVQKDAAIEAINDVIRQLERAADGTELANLFERVAATMIKYKIRALPLASAEQPGVIRCKDCKHRPTATRADEGITYGFSVEFPDKKCPCQCEDGWYNHYPDDDFYCGCAERREEPREN